MNDINKVRDFYDTQVQQINCLDEVCGSEFLPVYLRSPYLFVEEYLQNKIKSYGRDLKLLDLCCGTGVHAVRYAQLGYIVSGVDISSVSIEKAKNLAKKFKVVEKLDFTVQEIDQKLNFSDESFDVVFISGSLYYLDYEKIMPEILRVLKRGGTFACIETNGDNFIMNFVRKIKNIFLRHRDQQTIIGLLRFRDVEKILLSFLSVRLVYFDFFTMASYFFVWNKWLLKKWLKLAIVLDEFLLNKLGLRIFCFKFVIIGEK